MIKPATALHEEQRLAALAETELLDTPPEERFDRYTRLTRRLFGVPIALVSLVDRDRQWFKSRSGIETSETPRDVSFCGHAILDDELFIVEDAECDARFCDNPLVQSGPRIRFYAGCPLTGPDGHRLGTLCILDRQPRQFSAEDRQALRDVADMVSGELATFRMATTDELTGLSNRRAFRMIAGQSLRECVRGDREAALLLLDLDEFKSINDRLGHAAGDKALVEFAHLLTDCFRHSDVVARIGGDEFCVLLTGADEEQAWQGLERFRDAVEAKNDLPGRHYRLAFSAGVVQWDKRWQDDISRLLRDADHTMYERKQARAAARRLQR